MTSTQPPSLLHTLRTSTASMCRTRREITSRPWHASAQDRYLKGVGLTLTALTLSTRFLFGDGRVRTLQASGICRWPAQAWGHLLSGGVIGSALTGSAALLGASVGILGGNAAGGWARGRAIGSAIEATLRFCTVTVTEMLGIGLALHCGLRLEASAPAVQVDSSCAPLPVMDLPTFVGPDGKALLRADLVGAQASGDGRPGDDAARVADHLRHFTDFQAYQALLCPVFASDRPLLGAALQLNLREEGQPVKRDPLVHLLPGFMRQGTRSALMVSVSRDADDEDSLPSWRITLQSRDDGAMAPATREAALHTGNDGFYEALWDAYVTYVASPEHFDLPHHSFFPRALRLGMRKEADRSRFIASARGQASAYLHANDDSDGLNSVMVGIGTRPTNDERRDIGRYLLLRSQQAFSTVADQDQLVLDHYSPKRL